MATGKSPEHARIIQYTHGAEFIMIMSPKLVVHVLLLNVAKILTAARQVIHIVSSDSIEVSGSCYALPTRDQTKQEFVKTGSHSLKQREQMSFELVGNSMHNTL